MKKYSTRIAIAGIIIISMLAILYSLFQMNNNSKTDGFGGGSIRVTKCEVNDTAWKVYSCSGSYMSAAGLVEVKNATIRVTGKEYKSGAYIDDVYPTVAIEKLSKDPRSFVTGRERSSVLYNGPWLVMLFVGLLLPLGLILYVFGRTTATTRRES